MARARLLRKLGTLTTLGQQRQLSVYVQAARRRGATEQEIREVLCQVAMYAVFPNAWNAAETFDLDPERVREGCMQDALALARIPVHHAEEAHKAIPGSRLEIFDGVGHLPQLEAPGRFVAALDRFLVETEPAQWNTKQSG